MIHRWVFLLSCVVLGAGGAFGIACSNGNTITDGGTDQDATTDQQSMTDTKPMNDGGSMVPKCPSYPVQGPCDLVAQDCANGQECVRKGDPDMGYTTECVAPSSGSTPIGGNCQSPTQCVPGTECYMNRCAPHCCGDDDSTCKTSPDNKPGICNLIVHDSKNKEIGKYCVYGDNCKPFQIVPCPMGSTCVLKDMSGLATCSQINPAPGKDENQPCSFANECKDGLYCINSLPDGGGACNWGCYMKGMGGPYEDAGLNTKPPGQGGCPNGKSCKINVGGLPKWFGICAP